MPDEVRARRSKHGAGRRDDPLIFILAFLSLLLFLLALASRSAGPVFLGKSRFLWIATLTLGGVSFALFMIARRFPGAARIIKQGMLISVITVLLFELGSFFLARYLPVAVLLRTPSWVQNALPESAFERETYRVARPSEYPDDPLFARRFAPNLDVVLKNPEFQYRRRTDARGFANTDDSLYDSADVVVIGDSFTMGETVNFDESWPQRFAQRTGLRVLNLGMAGWDVYQYPLALEKYGLRASPGIIIVTLTNANDLTPRYYDYKDYRAAHEDVKGMRDYAQRAGVEGVRWETGPNYFSNVVVLAEQLFLPFSSAFFRVITSAKSQRACTFVLNGERLALYFRHQRVYLKESPLSWRRNDVAEDLAHISALADALGAQLYYLYLPGPEEIYIPLLGAAAEKDACTTAIFSAYASGRFEMNSVVAAYEEALGNRVPRLLNATPYLQQAAGEGPQLTWTYDFHPNALGHQRIAEFVATHVGTP